MSHPDNSDDIIDSRDVIEAINEIEQEINMRIIDALFPDAGEGDSENDPAWSDVASANIDAADGINVLPQNLWPVTDDGVCSELWDLADALVPLRKLDAQGTSLSDWQYGVTLVRDSYFEDFAESFARDICPSREVAEAMEQWPYRCIDWEQAARELQTDYTSIDFDGVTYWAR